MKYLEDYRSPKDDEVKNFSLDDAEKIDALNKEIHLRNRLLVHNARAILQDVFDDMCCLGAPSHSPKGFFAANVKTGTCSLTATVIADLSAKWHVGLIALGPCVKLILADQPVAEQNVTSPLRP